MKYTAITIGPIINSLSLAHRTKELWAASYFFAYLMGKIIEHIDTDKIILPHKSNNSLNVKSAGIFPDRLILETNGIDVKSAIYNAVKETANKFNVNGNDILKHIYIRTVNFDFKKRNNIKDDNIIFQANDFLAITELQANYVTVDNEVFLKMLQKIDEAPIYKDDIFKNQKRFPSIIEIATKKSLNLNDSFFNNNDEDDDIWAKLKKERKEHLKLHHKYIAIVQADGDNIGKIIKKVAASNDINQIKQFSTALSDFATAAANKIDEFGGIPVYVGGDDLLFFAPVHNGQQSIINLILDLDEIFNDKLIKNENLNTFIKDIDPKPSMSYGISISYYKYPMHEALTQARTLLFDNAKQEPKNAIAFKVLKHSGQFFETVIHKPLDQKAIDLLNSNGLAIHSLIYNFERHKSILKSIIDNEDLMTNFFDNIYNEQEHKNKETKELIDNVKDMLTDSYQKTNDFDKTIKQIYALLRYVKFINTKYDE